MEPVLDHQGRVQIFDSKCKFISQDTEHLTKGGAKFYANFFDRKEDFILNKIIKDLD